MIDIQTSYDKDEERFTVTVGPEDHVSSTTRYFYVTPREPYDEQEWAAHQFAQGAFAALDTARHLITHALQPQVVKDKQL